MAQLKQTDIKNTFLLSKNNNIEIEDVKNFISKMDSDIQKYFKTNYSDPNIVSFNVVKTISSAGTSFIITSLNTLRTIFGVPNVTLQNFYIIINNGDGVTSPAHMDGVTWLNNNLYIVFDRSINKGTNIRFNFAVIYTSNYIEPTVYTT